MSGGGGVIGAGVPIIASKSVLSVLDLDHSDVGVEEVDHIAGGATLACFNLALEEYRVKKNDEAKLLRELVHKYTSNGILLTTTNGGNFSKLCYVLIPTVQAKSVESPKKKCMKVLLKEDNFMDKVISHFCKSEKKYSGAEYIASYIGEKFVDEFCKAAKHIGLVIGEKMSALMTGAMWSEAGVHQKSKQRMISSYVRSHLGNPLFASELEVNTIALENKSAQRVYGDTLFQKIIPLETKSVGGQSDKIVQTKVEYYVECPYKNTLLE